MRHTRLAQLLTSVFVAVPLLVSCSGHHAAGGYRLPGSIHYNNVWSAEPEIDLVSPELIVARAFFESLDITMQTGTNTAYPGFKERLPHSPFKSDYHFEWDFDPPRSAQPMYGTLYWRALEVKQEPDAVRVTACEWQNALAFPDGDKYAQDLPAVAMPPRAEWVELRPPSAGVNERTSEGTGPGRYPTTDVFGGWTIKDASLVSDKHYHDQCSATPDNPVPTELRGNTPKTFDKPLPALPPVPGWPN
jgi:hypothetical protein